MTSRQPAPAEGTRANKIGVEPVKKPTGAKEGAKGSRAAFAQHRVRIVWVDQLRGAAIVAMVFYHLLYDLRTFYEIDVFRDMGWTWKVGHLLIAGAFFFVSGMAGGLAGRGGMAIRHAWRRLFQIGGAAVAISVVTFVLFPDEWIYFGILHSMFACGLLCLPLRNSPKLCWIAAVGGALLYLGTGSEIPPKLHAEATLDYVPLFPWICVYLAGMGWIWVGVGVRGMVGGVAGGILNWAGRWPLTIYLVHQPVLLGVLWLFFHFAAGH